MKNLIILGVLFLSMTILFSCGRKKGSTNSTDLSRTSYKSDNELLLYLQNMKPVTGIVDGASDLCQQLAGVDHSRGYECHYTYKEGIVNGISTHYKSTVTKNMIILGSYKEAI